MGVKYILYILVYKVLIVIYSLHWVIMLHVSHQTKNSHLVAPVNKDISSGIDGLHYPLFSCLAR